MKKLIRVTAIVLIVTILTFLLVSCKINKGDDLHTLYYKDYKKRDEVTAVFYNHVANTTEEVKMTAIGEDEDGYTYSCKGNVSTYDTVGFRYDGFNTTKVAFNRCVSGWYNSEKGFLPYTEGLKNPYKSRLTNEISFDNDLIVYNNDMYDDVTFTFNGYDKVVHIWTPDDYDPSSEEKYAAVYLLDGQGAIYLGFPDETLLDSDHADVQVQSMTTATGYKAIVVAIDTFGDEQHYSRIDELIPDLGELAYDEDTKKCGNMLSDFISDTVVTYVQENYNVYTDAAHTSIAGESLGGLEFLYIAMEHPEIFGTAGVLSPSFMLYTDNTWRSYLSGKSFDKQSPFLYFYSGNEVEDNGDVTDEMVARIKEMGYPEDRFTYHRDEVGGHSSIIWRSIFSEFLNAMVFESGVGAVGD